MKFPYLKVSYGIQAPAPKVWKVITDTTLWPKWGTTVRDVDSRGRYITSGTRGRVKTIVGLWLPFTITKFEEGRCWSWKVVGISATGHSIETLGANRCVLTFEVPLLAAPYIILCIPAMRRIRRISEQMHNQV